MTDEYCGHICVAQEPGCSCATHADALRERDRLRAEVEWLQHLLAVVRHTEAEIEQRTLDDYFAGLEAVINEYGEAFLLENIKAGLRARGWEVNEVSRET